MTLPELLISITLMGLLATVLSAAITVTYRSAGSTEGRANVARAESAVDTWLPADLASTDVNNLDVGGSGRPSVELAANVEPCGSCGSIDLSGANALQLAWEAGGQLTKVQYQYIFMDDEWQLRRIECVGSSPCSVAVILHDLEAPPDLATYNPNTDRPVWVMDVAIPNNVSGLELSDNARRIVVTIDGGGENIGAGGGLNSINLTAGGRNTEEIAADKFTVPSFVRARSRCGGPITLIVDDSGSIGDGNVNSVVKPGVKAFIEAFRGTPTKVQVVQFSTTARTIGPNSATTSSNGGWHRYVDMTNDAQIDQLLAAVDSSLTADGGTNWEEAFFRTFKESSGDNAQILPNRVVFFTDGIPTYSRNQHRTGTMRHYNDGAYTRVYSSSDPWGWLQADGGNFNQESWDRTDVILDDHRAADMIFVGVGSGLQEGAGTGTNNYWTHNPVAEGNRNAPRGNAFLKKGETILAYLLSNAPSDVAGNGPSGEVRAEFVNGEYTNPEAADFYVQSNFNAEAFAKAMKAAALKDCGGTVTVQTRLTDGTPVADEVVYENTAFRNDDGTKINTNTRTVTTSSNFRTGTFDFEISDESEYFSVDVYPSALHTLDGYQFEGWSCRAGAASKPPIVKDIDNSTFKGFTIDVKPNEAISCIMQVSEVSP